MFDDGPEAVNQHTKTHVSVTLVNNRIHVSRVPVDRHRGDQQVSG
jgi:hypothetical protein